MVASVHDRLIASRAVNKTAALHVAGGERTDSDLLRWAQQEAFDRVMTQVRLETGEALLKARRTLEAARQRLRTLKPGTYYHTDFARHVEKLRMKVEGQR